MVTYHCFRSIAYSNEDKASLLVYYSANTHERLHYLKQLCFTLNSPGDNSNLNLASHLQFTFVFTKNTEF